MGALDGVCEHITDQCATSHQMHNVTSDSGEQSFVMSGRPAELRQRDLKQMIFAAQKAGAKEVRVHLTNGAVVVIPIPPGNVECPEPENSNNSFDKIMRKPGA